MALVADLRQQRSGSEFLSIVGARMPATNFLFNSRAYGKLRRRACLHREKSLSGCLGRKPPFLHGLIDAETIRSQRVRYGRKARADGRSSSSKIEDRNQHLEAGQVDSSALGYSKSRNEAREKSLIHRCG